MENGKLGLDAVLLDLNLNGQIGLDVLTDIQKQFSQVAVVMFTAYGSVMTAVEAMRRGVLDYMGKPFQREKFMTVIGRLQRSGQMNRRIERLENEVTQFKTQGIEPIFDFTTPVMHEVIDILLRAAITNASILLCGESGTGKSVLPRTVHNRKRRPVDKAFVTVNCPSLSKELLESEVFGHVRGSFTGAIKNHWGRVKAAEGGTLSLDEIGDLAWEIQAKLLRLLQEREYERIGENITRRANLRIIAATNRDLRTRVAQGLFREDLYFRFYVITVEIRPLRSCDGDLIRFAEHNERFFAEKYLRKRAGFTPEALATILAYVWPGNLRELRNEIERSVILMKREQILPDDFPLELESTPAEIAASGEDTTSVGAS